MASKTAFSFDLQPGGRDVENNNFHNLNEPGEKERRAVYDQGRKLNMQMNLIEIVHGTMDQSPTSEKATLIIAEFRFTTQDPSRVFQKAIMELRFCPVDAKDHTTPEVIAIAPHGTWSLNRTDKVQESTHSAKVDAGATFVANVSTGLEWSRTVTETKYSMMTLTGMSTKRMTQGKKNTAVWSMTENKDDDQGIPSMLRAVMVLKRPHDKDFFLHVDVSTKITWRVEGFSPSVESDKSGSDTDPVRFSPKLSTKVPAYIDAAKLGEYTMDSEALNKLMAIQTRGSVAPALPDSTLTDGKPYLGTQEPPEHAKTTTNTVVPEVNSPSKELRLPKSEAETIEEATSKVSFNETSSGYSTTKTETSSKLAMENETTSIPQILENTGLLSNGVKTEEGSTLEDTMKLLLHAVRKGVEVMAEAVRNFFHCFF